MRRRKSFCNQIYEGFVFTSITIQTENIEKYVI